MESSEPESPALLADGIARSQTEMELSAKQALNLSDTLVEDDLLRSALENLKLQGKRCMPQCSLTSCRKAPITQTAHPAMDPMAVIPNRSCRAGGWQKDKLEK